MLFYHSRKGRELFFKIIAAAGRTGMSGAGILLFQKFAYLSAISAFKFKNRHKVLLIRLWRIKIEF